MFIGVSEKNAGKRSGGQFVGRGGVDVWKTKTAKHTELGVVWMTEKKRVKRSCCWIDRRGSDVKKIGSCAEGLGPKLGWHR